MCSRLMSPVRAALALVAGCALSMPGMAFAADRIDVKVAFADPAGQAWDGDGSAPDVQICIVTAANKACNAAALGTCQDKFDCTFNVVIPNEPFALWVYDADPLQSDIIGSAFCKGAGKNWKVRACEVVKGLRFVTMYQ